MKKLILSASLATASFISCYAQEITFGPRLGFTYATTQYFSDEDFIREDFNESAKYLPGFQAGVAANLKVTDNFSFQPELYFTQQGDKFEIIWPEDNTSPNYSLESKSTYRRNYLQLPLLAKYAIGSGKVKYFVTGGPGLSYLLGGKIKSKSIYREEGELKTYEQETKLEFGDGPGSDYNRLDLALIGGIGAGMPLGNGTLTLDVRFQQSFTSLAGSLVSSTMATNRVISAGVGYMFGAKE